MFWSTLFIGVIIKNNEEVFSVSPHFDDYFPDVAAPFFDPVNNGRCMGDDWRWEKMHIDGAEGIRGVDWGWGRTVVDFDAIAVGQQWVGGHGDETSINENNINISS